MKTLLLLLVALAVATRPAQALQCHVCTSSTNCEKPERCSLTSRFCKTMVKVETLSGNLVQKECAESCTPRDTAQGQVSSGKATISCCQEDLCNWKLHSAARPCGPLASTTLSLALALGLLAFILGPSL